MTSTSLLVVSVIVVVLLLIAVAGAALGRSRHRGPARPPGTGRHRGVEASPPVTAVGAAGTSGSDEHARAESAAEPRTPAATAATQASPTAQSGQAPETQTPLESPAAPDTETAPSPLTALDEALAEAQTAPEAPTASETPAESEARTDEQAPSEAPRAKRARRRGYGWVRPWATWTVATAAIGGFAAYAALSLPKAGDVTGFATLSVKAPAGGSGPHLSSCSGPVTGARALPSTGLGFTVTVASGRTAVTGLEFAPAPSLVGGAPATPAGAGLPTANEDSPVTSAAGAADIILSTAVVLPVDVPAGTSRDVAVRVMPGNNIGQNAVTWSVIALGPQRQRLGELCMAG